jgi:hypothetical protein
MRSGAGDRYLALEERPLVDLPGCEPGVYVDGIEHWDVLRPSEKYRPRVRDWNFLPTELIEGIEVYSGVTAPAQFDTHLCGVVLIWTRR